MFPANTKILVADDAKTIRTSMREILQNLGFRNIFDAEDGKQALNQMIEADDSKSPFGFIIADWNMPGMTGIELLDIRNTDERFRNIPFLMVTIESERDYVLKAVAMGVSDFIVKPFSEMTIRMKMQGIWNRLNR